MTGNSQVEIEAKFMLRDSARVISRLVELNAAVVSPRTFEMNLRLDTPHGELKHAGKVLRIRDAQAVTVTFKGPSSVESGTLLRKEVEFQVDNLENTRQLFEALGYRVSHRYDKYRTVYRVGKALIMLDELPFGIFIEIEAETVEEVHQTASLLNLNIQAAIEKSYLGLFSRLKENLSLQGNDLTFQALDGLAVTSNDLAVGYADDFQEA